MEREREMLDGAWQREWQEEAGGVSAFVCIQGLAINSIWGDELENNIRGHYTEEKNGIKASA